MLFCQEGDHQQSEIIGVCLNNVCSKQGLCCFYCFKMFHLNHIHDIMNFKDFINWKKRKEQTFNIFKENINQLQQCTKLLSDFISEIVIIDEQVENQSYQNLTKEIKHLIIIDQLEKSIMNKLSELASLIPPLKLEIQQLKSSRGIYIFQKGQYQIKNESFSGSIDCISQQGYSEERIIQIDSIVIPIQKQQLNFTFSNKNKHEDILISYQGKEAKSSSIFIQTRYVICNELITENSFARIKVQCGESVSIGVCLQNITFQQMKPYEAILDGAYILNNEGVITTYPKDLKYSEQKFCGIGFGDIIIVEVNMRDKKITWINKTAKNKIFVFFIFFYQNLIINENVQGLYFIFGLTSNVFDSSFLKII
ncbi:unnamed protein product [Paramecium pentaurelia]|uniref:SPRY domain-containing protein n=1 Tax=Paramecium pentaurelia TaxID=43138 RepID=A0A8S1XQJ4_9CILI|nr:unnamed protein product [Paramecium pentaurelia]